MPDGHSDLAESQRQVMVVEEDLERQEQLCAILNRHDLKSFCTHPLELAMAAQGWTGVILVSHRSGATAWQLANRVRTFNPEAPIILFALPSDRPSGCTPAIQSCLAPDEADGRLADEVRRCFKLMRPVRPPARLLGEIMLVDDDAKLRRILQDFLELKGFSVKSAASGEEALGLLQNMLPSAIVLDMKMPGMDGLMTLKHIRLIHPNLPVVFATQLDEEQAVEEAMELGAHDYLVKPFNLEHLEAVLLTKVFT
jgi:DNA-binding response OmpR family regulator